MGSSESKPAGPQVWKASGPTGVSQDLVESLQSSHETDASRAKSIELEVESRVAQKLRMYSKAQDEALTSAHQRLDKAPEPEDDKTPSRASVTKEIDELRRKLDTRRAVRDLPDSVEGARSEVVRCLRENDRRPLDCWQEVETFKAEVKKLEKSWVDKVVS